MTERTQEALRAIRNRRGMTQGDMDQAIGTSPSYWNKYESGARRPALTMLTRMMMTIGLTDEEILSVVRAVAVDRGVDGESGG